jgi:hypothetical protein
MEFEPTIEGVRRKDLVEYADELGEVCIGRVGGMPEREHAFYYRDAKYEFCFYADCKCDGDKFDIDVKNATVQRFHGSRPRIDYRDLDRIARNMARFFAERRFLSSRKPVPPNETFRSLKLSWRL